MLSSGADVDTYTKTKIIEIDHHEEGFSHRATVRLDNSDKALNAEDYKGYKAVISLGAYVGASDYYSPAAPLYVVDQRFNSAVGVLDCVLEIVGVPDLLAYDSASAAYQPDEDNADTYKTIIQAILGATMACFNHCTAYTVEFDSEDEIIDTIQPEDTFRVSLGQSRAAALRWLLDRTKCVMRWEDDEKFHIFKPTTSAAGYNSLLTSNAAAAQAVVNVTSATGFTANDWVVISRDSGVNEILQILSISTNAITMKTNLVNAYTTADNAILTLGCYSYSLDSGHTFFSKAYQNSLVMPNKITVMSDPDTDDGFIGHATDADSYAKLPFQKWYYHRIDSDAEAEDIAEALLSKEQLHAQIGAASVPMNCGQEVFDYINITDSRQTKNRAGNIGSIDRHYQAHTDTREGGIFEMSFTFGGWFSVRKILKDLEVYSDEGYYFQRLSVKDLYVENLLADNIDLITLDDITDGSTYQRVKSVHLDSGQIVLNDTIQYATGYNPSTKGRSFYSEPTTPYDLGDLWFADTIVKRCTTARASGAYVAGDWTAVDMDDIGDGITYQRLLATQIQAGKILLSAECTYSTGYDPSGKRRTFTATPTTPYSVGDIWVDGTDFKRCITALAEGAYNAAHWEAVTLDEIAEGTTYGRLNLIDIDSVAGHIKLTTSAVFDGVWYEESGVKIDAAQGIDLAGNDIRWFYSGGLVGNLYGVSGGMMLLGDDDVSIVAGATGGIMIGAVHAITPSTNDIIMDADDDILVHADSGINITVGSGKVIKTTEADGELEIDCGTNMKLDADTAMWLEASTIYTKDLEPAASGNDIGEAAEYNHIKCDTIYYTGGSLPDDLDDLALIKAIKNNPDGKISMSSLPDMLKINHTDFMAHNIEKVDRHIDRVTAKYNKAISLFEAEEVKNNKLIKKYEKDEQDTPFEWDKVVKREMKVKLSSRNAKINNSKQKAQEETNKLVAGRQAQIDFWEERYVYVSSKFIPLGPEVELILGGMKQLIERVEALEAS